MQGLALLGIYLVVACAGQAVGYGISSLVERTVPWAGMPVFLAVFFGMLVLAWPVAVKLMDWLFPEVVTAPAGSPVGAAQPSLIAEGVAQRSREGRRG
jgi:hypothetical protein